MIVEIVSDCKAIPDCKTDKFTVHNHVIDTIKKFAPRSAIS